MCLQPPATEIKATTVYANAFSEVIGSDTFLVQSVQGLSYRSTWLLQNVFNRDGQYYHFGNISCVCVKLYVKHEMIRVGMCFHGNTNTCINEEFTATIKMGKMNRKYYLKKQTKQ